MQANPAPPAPAPYSLADLMAHLARKRARIMFAALLDRQTSA